MNADTSAWEQALDEYQERTGSEVPTGRLPVAELSKIAARAQEIKEERQSAA